MTLPSTTQKCPNSHHSGPEGCLPAPNIFHLANEFAKGENVLELYLEDKIILHSSLRFLGVVIFDDMFL